MPASNENLIVQADTGNEVCTELLFHLRNLQ